MSNPRKPQDAAGIKARALKKYEASPDAIVAREGDPPLEFFSPFGPMIGRAQLPRPIVDRVNRFADGFVSPTEGREFSVPKEVSADGGEGSLANFIASAIGRYLAGMENTRVTRVDFENIWIVSQYAGTPSPVHFHTGDLSGVLYLKVPQVEEGQEAHTYISGRQAGYINFLAGGKQRFSRSLISFKPRVGDFYVFPGWLLHVAEPFRGGGERRSLAFNAFVAAEE
ncbi:MAG TPA: putative 2OG-Fe(II) oxygenase [Burkholderiales bacterium]|nr:putative 2OG-Fe(II) oxygenase [Burkholderiales bacterium]